MKKQASTQTGYDKAYKKRLAKVLTKLRHGDKARAAEVSGYSEEMVKKVCAGKRNSWTIVCTLEVLAEQRDQLQAQMRQLHKSRKQKKAA